MEIFFEQFWQLILGVSGTVLAFLFGRRKTTAEVETLTIANMSTINQEYIRLLNETESRLKERIDSLEKELHNCKRDMANKLLLIQNSNKNET